MGRGEEAKRDLKSAGGAMTSGLCSGPTLRHFLRARGCFRAGLMLDFGYPSGFSCRSCDGLAIASALDNISDERSGTAV